MRVFEVAKELSVPAESLVHLLREMDIPVRSHMTDLADEHVARLRTVIERERRLGHKDVGEALEAAIGDAAGAPKRRRRKREETEGGTPETAPDSTADPVADAADAIAADAAAAAAERGAELVTTGGAPPRGVTVVVDSSVLPPAEPDAPAEAAP
ncbi:MAG: translation initiation factor IF-2 N-terminal domain-containing protein, partial [Gemmatimonadetes bacterium]|nr:translation initiation factor IF-2 N-terminal domain-containing protein [Gemmatimonadota bacterium]